MNEVLLIELELVTVPAQHDPNLNLTDGIPRTFGFAPGT